MIVVAAVIEQNGRFLVARRLRGTHLAGYWEFPGGKIGDGEALEDALRREIREELNTGIHGLSEVFRTKHVYPDRTIELHFYCCGFEGEPKPMLGQEMQWIERSRLRELPFPEADAELVNQLAAK